ncbi:MAG TPA: dUTP diphosphatase [Gaiellaceae bacterium]|nr:dUTP diphosphatase [Gaiellaceae bacterium]
MTEFPIRRLRAGAVLPSRAYPGDAGLDLTAVESAELAPREGATIGTGLAIALPEGYAGLVLPRSGLATKHQIGVLNAPGLIDAGYRGELRVILHNHGDQTFRVHAGMRIAQLVVVAVEDVRLVEVDELPASERGEGGHGSSGL